MHPQAPAPCAPAANRADPAALPLQFHQAYVPSAMPYADPALSPPSSPTSSFAVTPGVTTYPVNQPAPSQLLGVAPSDHDDTFILSKDEIFVLSEDEWEVLFLEAERIIDSIEN